MTRRRRDLAEKGWVPLRYWVLWWTLIGIADVLFYVVLTPIWMGLRAVAWIADLRGRARRKEAARAAAGSDRRTSS